jgi:hypothetical protein
VTADIIKLATDRGELIVGDDGYYVYWPAPGAHIHGDGAWTTGGGCYTATELRALANELDRLNAAWDKIVQNDPAIAGGTE